MSSRISILLFILISACSSIQEPVKPHAPKEFSRGEIILGTQLLSKIFDQEMAPLACVPDMDKASLLLRTIHPRMEVVQDDLEAILDDASEVQKLIETCDQNCTCSFVDELLREHLVALPKALKTTLNKKKKQKDLNACLNYVKETFCSSELYQELNKEKGDFSFEEANP
jgi:hypothetical protein